MVAGSRDDELAGLDSHGPRQTFGITKMSAPDIGRRQSRVPPWQMNEEALRIVAAKIREAREDFAHRVVGHENTKTRNEPLTCIY
jgi:hypothetical protein